MIFYEQSIYNLLFLTLSYNNYTPMLATSPDLKNNSKILLVEDDRNFGDVLRSYLEMHGYNVDLAVDGIDGFEHFRRKEYDLCILDVMMPMYLLSF